MRIILLVGLLLAVGVGGSAWAGIQDTYQEAVSSFERGDYNEAIELLQKVLDSPEQVNQAPIYNLLGLIYLRQDESIASAIGSFQQAVQIDPNYSEPYFNLASTYAGPGNNPELAAFYFKKTIEVDPNYTRAYFGLGWFTLMGLQDAPEAAKYFEKTIAIFPDFIEAYYGLGLSQVQMGKAPLALAQVSKLREMGRNDLASYLEIAIRGDDVPRQLESEQQSPMPMLEEVSPMGQSGMAKKPEGNPSARNIPQASDFLNDSADDWNLS